MQYRWASLLAAVTVLAIAVVIGLFIRPSSLERSLQSDLGLPPAAALTIIDASVANRAIAVSTISGQSMLFAAFQESSDGEAWYIPIAAGSGAPLDMPEAVIECSRTYDHYPTAAEIAVFRHDFGLNP